MLTEDMSQSNMFKLQVDEMLVAVRPDYAEIVGFVDKALRRLKALIESIEDREPVTAIEAARSMYKVHKITIPFPETARGKDVPFKLAFSSPSEVNVVGSYALKTMVQGDHLLVVDLVVTLPLSILQVKDYLNYRYFYKRAYYLACLAAGLRDGCSNEFEFYFKCLGGNSLQPILVAKPIDAISLSRPKYLIHVILAAPEGLFNEMKLRPSKNAVRPNLGFTDETDPLDPTPFYNATLRAESNIKQYLNLLQRSSKSTEGFIDACILGQIWLRQRGFGGTISAGGFGHFEWATITALLLQGGGPRGQSVLSPSYTSYQIFKSVIKYLSSTDLITIPVLFQAPEVSIPDAKSPIFYDGPRGHNILFKMTPWSYTRLLEEAKISSEMLNEPTFDQFEATFMLKKDLPLQEYDFSFQLSSSIAIEESTSLDHANQGALVCSKIYSVLTEGLTNRVNTIQLKIPEPFIWPLKATPSIGNSGICVNVVFDPANVGRLVDRGPAAEEKKSAIQFRKFWGEKAELRRFRDGSIVECLVWSNNSDASLFKEIVNYLLNRHLGDEISKSVKFTNFNFCRLLPGPESSMKSFDNLKAAFRALEQDIRSLENLPLQPKAVFAISSQLRASSVIQPDFCPHRHLRDPAEVLIEFEGSGRWPDDIVTIQQTKVAFLLKVGDLLTASVGGIITNLLLENMEQPSSNCAVLDVTYPSGAAFRLRIYIDRELALLERLITEKATSVQVREKAISAKSLATYMCIQLPLHHQSVATHCTRYPALSPSIRLVKKWFSSHMLLGHISEELVELFVLRTFLHPYPWRAPSSASTGLIRTLRFLSKWDWRTTPLIVDFSGSMATEELAAINTRLKAWRNIDPEMKRIALLAATNHDMTGTIFTDRRPSKVVAARMTALAQSAFLAAKDQSLDLDMDTLFRSNLSDYDFVVHISPNFVGDRKGKLRANAAKFKNLKSQPEEDLPLASTESVSLFLEELQRLYTSSVMFFHDPLSNLAIGGLWNPHTRGRELKTNLRHATKPRSRGAGDYQHVEVEIDRLAILSEIARFGGNIVARIDVHE